MKFIWKIENYSCLNDGMLPSPPFRFYDTDWELRIYPRGYSSDDDHIQVDLYQLQFIIGMLNCAVTFLDSEGLPLIWIEKKNIKLQGCSRMSESFCIKRKEVFGKQKSKFLPNDNLTVQCIFWKTAAELVDTVSCYVRTRIEPQLDVREKTFTLNIPEVSSFGSNDFIDHIETFNGGSLRILVSLNKDKRFQTKISLPGLLRIHSNCKISILDVAGKEIEFASGKYYFLKDSVWILPTNITKDLLMCYQNQFLPNDSLSLVFKCTLSFIVSFNQMVDEHEIFTNSPNPIASAPPVPEPTARSIVPNVKPPSSPDSSDTISQVVKSMYEEGFMSDFSLGVGDKTFPVHKNILGARSSVFRAMFTADMKEKESGHVDIPDVDADTIQRMLKFVYCDLVEEDLQWESVSSLYTAADKYALYSLKKKCTDLLKSGLSSSSVFGVLLLADSYQDQDLEATAVDFIGRNDKDIIGTERWSKFAVENGQLAFDTIQKLYLKKMNV